MIAASCHCGAVKIEVSEKPESLTQCTCSICRRYGALWAYFTSETTRVISAPGSVKGYRWNDKFIEFCHCKTCGCMTHYRATKKYKNNRVAVNARMMEPSDIEGIEVRTFDGADTWEYLDV